MSTKPDASDGNEVQTISHAADWLGEKSNAVTDGESTKPCAACGDPDGVHQLTLVVDWVDYLVDEYNTRTPEEECVVPLCTRCRSWAEMLEIAEMNLSDHGRAEQEKILEERNRFLESLRAELISNFAVSQTLSVYK